MIDSGSTTRPPLPPNDKFGYLFAAISALASGYAYWQQAGWLSFVFFGLGAAFAATARFAPEVLAPLNRLWFELGILLGKIVSPIVLGVIFFVLITPVAFVTRLFGRDPLLIKKRTTGSYWIDRDPPGPKSDSFKNQF